MPRILGITIPDEKKILYSLPYVYGIGLTSAKIILKTAHIDENKKAKELSDEELSKIQKIIEGNYRVEGDLRRDVSQNVKRLKEIGSWRGMRHAKKLPVHGRSKTNSRTSRSPGPGPNTRKTMGSGRKPSAQKT